MILFDFPGIERRTLDLDLICPDLAWCNMVALTSSPGRSWFPEIQGTLSIKCAVDGEETYLIDGQPLRVNAGKYLIVNQGQRYASQVEGSHDTESLCIFFRPGFAEEALRNRLTPDDHLLDDPTGEGAQPVYFFEKTYRNDDTVSPTVTRIHQAVSTRQFTRGWMEEQFHRLMDGMLGVHRNVVKEIRRLPSIRLATRVEIYRRLSRARDFMESNYTHPIGLGEIARGAALSQHHFLRLFKNAFGITPHQYLTQLRLERARTLLATTEMPVTEICFELGFESPNSFTLLFRRHVGVSPREYRKEMRGSGT